MKSATSALEKFSLIDLYAGPGGLSLGFRSSGLFNPVVAVEFNVHAAESYESNLGVEVIRKDVGEVAAKELLEAAKKQGFGRVLHQDVCPDYRTPQQGKP